MPFTETRIKGRSLVRGMAQGEAIVAHQPLSFLGGVNPDSGVVTERGHALEGVCVTNKILVFPYGKGSTVGSYTIFAMAKKGTKPAGIINTRTESIIASGCVLAEIPLMDSFEKDPVQAISNGDFVVMDANHGFIIIRYAPGHEKPSTL